jgi:hypothetical protein
MSVGPAAVVEAGGDSVRAIEASVRDRFIVVVGVVAA